MRYTQYYYPLAHWDTVRISTTANIGLYHVLVGGIPTPLKNMSSSVGMIFHSQLNGKIKMFQATNQNIWVFQLLAID